MSTSKEISGGICGLAIAMGVGRFAYTPLLPGMQEQFGFNDVVAGVMASVNYFGYLLGAFLCRKPLSSQMKMWGFRYALIFCLLTTLLMGIWNDVTAWMIIRFISGVASAAVFVLASAIVMDELKQTAYAERAILIYSGVGLGIAFSGMASPPLIRRFGVQNAWVGLALICMPVALWCWYAVVTRSENQPFRDIQEVKPPDNDSTFLPWLLAAYFCEGFGYIVSATFLVSFLQQSAAATSSGNLAWVIVGLSASVSVPFFHIMSRCYGPIRILILAHGVQALGVILPVLSNHWFAVNTGAVLFGATFMGIVALSLYVGKTIHPDRSQTVIGLLTAVYGVGQILGPLVSGALSLHSGNFASSLTLSAAVIALGGALLLMGSIQTHKRQRRISHA